MYSNIFSDEMNVNEIWGHPQCNKRLADDHAGVKAICILVRDDERLGLRGSTVAELNNLAHNLKK